MSKTINEILSEIQLNLKAPKSQTNDFGKYKYRSCEDILEAVKPLLKQTNTTLVLDDELINIGDRFYIKATATLCSCEKLEGTHSISVCGYAREEESKRGMDGSQITGACSSYARKYALNGLFLIDDTKDSDSTNKHGGKTQKDKLKGVVSDLNKEAYDQIEKRKKAISQYSLLLEMKNPANQKDLLKTFKTKNIDQMRKLYKELQES